MRRGTRITQIGSEEHHSEILVQEASHLGRSTVEVLKVLQELTSLHVSVYVQNFRFATLKAVREI